MFQYKLPNKGPKGEEYPCVLKINGDIISGVPFYPGNKDYEEYLKWLEEGNTPLPADE